MSDHFHMKPTSYQYDPTKRTWKYQSLYSFNSEEWDWNEKRTKLGLREHLSFALIQALL